MYLLHFLAFLSIIRATNLLPGLLTLKYINYTHLTQPSTIVKIENTREIGLLHKLQRYAAKLKIRIQLIK